LSTFGKIYVTHRLGIFPNDGQLLQTQAWVNDTFKVQYRLVDSCVIEYKKITDAVSDCTLQLIFKKLPLFKF
jgi:hypothetical protein